MDPSAEDLKLLAYKFKSNLLINQYNFRLLGIQVKKFCTIFSELTLRKKNSICFWRFLTPASLQ
ncbi:unnamed protein product [Brassica oleracea]